MAKPRKTPREKLLEKALLVAVRSLDFYANGDTYLAIGFRPDPPCGDFIRDFSKTPSITGTYKRPGKQARKALLKINEIINGKNNGT